MKPSTSRIRLNRLERATLASTIGLSKQRTVKSFLVSLLKTSLTRSRSSTRQLVQLKSYPNTRKCTNVPTRTTTQVSNVNASTIGTRTPLSKESLKLTVSVSESNGYSTAPPKLSITNGSKMHTLKPLLLRKLLRMLKPLQLTSSAQLRTLGKGSPTVVKTTYTGAGTT